MTGHPQTAPSPPPVGDGAPEPAAISTPAAGSGTLKTDHEGSFESYTTRALVEDTATLLREGDIIFGDGDQDYAAAAMLEVLGALHDATGIDLELLPQVRGFCIVLLDQAGWSR